MGHINFCKWNTITTDNYNVERLSIYTSTLNNALITSVKYRQESVELVGKDEGDQLDEYSGDYS